MNKGILTGLVVVLVVVVAGVGWALYANMHANSQNGQYGATQNTTAPNQGKVYVGVTDAAANMGAVTAVNMTVDKVYLHSQAQGWVTVSSTPQTVDLLALHSAKSTALLAQTNVAADTYDQIWFHVASVKVTESGKVKTATLPSNDFKMNTAIVVAENAATSAKADVLADQSLHETSSGEVVFAPVVTFESRSNAAVTVDANNMENISGGTVDSSTTAGMDIDGTVKTNFKLDANTNLQINNGIINIKGTGTSNTGVNVGL